MDLLGKDTSPSASCSFSISTTSNTSTSSTSSTTTTQKIITVVEEIVDGKVVSSNTETISKTL